MEIYRTDGSGKSYANERLFNLVKSVDKYTTDGFFDCIDVIRDHKGNLMIKLNDNYKKYSFDIEYFYAVFLTFWTFENDYLVSIIFNNVCIYGFDLNSKILW